MSNLNENYPCVDGGFCPVGFRDLIPFSGFANVFNGA